MIAVYIIAGLAALWTVFLGAPSLVMYHQIFRRRAPGEPTAENLAPSGIAAHTERILENAERMKSRERTAVKATAADGVVLCGDFYDAGADRTVIFFHGYNTNPMKNFALHANLFLDRGYNALVVRQRAVLDSGGKHNGMGLIERYDVPVWIARARELSPGCSIILYGMSMGASTVAYASGDLDPAVVSAMVLDCGFTSPIDQLTSDCERRHLPKRTLLFLISLFARMLLGIDLRESVREPLSRTKIPAFFMHGDADLTVPVGQGRANFAACASEKEMIELPGASHTEVLLAGGDEAVSRLFEFLEKHGRDDRNL